MKTVLLLSSIITFSLLSFHKVHAYKLNRIFIKPDSIPLQVRDQLKQFDSLYGKLTSDRLFTLIITTNRLESGQDLLLPPNADQKTLTVSSGVTPLLLGRDYIFLTDSNKLHITDKSALNSEQPLRITYERPTLGR
jgi:hypothetical protein